MKKIDHLLFNGKPIKGLTTNELYYVIERLFLFIDPTEVIKQFYNCPVTVKVDESTKRRVWVDKLNSWVLVPKEFDLREEAVYIIKLLDRAKKLKKIVKEKN